MLRFAIHLSFIFSNLIKELISKEIISFWSDFFFNSFDIKNIFQFSFFLRKILNFTRFSMKNIDFCRGRMATLLWLCYYFHKQVHNLRSFRLKKFLLEKLRSVGFWWPKNSLNYAFKTKNQSTLLAVIDWMVHYSYERNTIPMSACYVNHKVNSERHQFKRLFR